MYRVLRIYLLFLFLVLNLLSVNIANADEDYIGAEDIGQDIKKITISAKPEAILSTVGYSAESPSQMANWVDSEYYTNGDDGGFFLEITGGWSPWGADTSDASKMCITTTENKYSDEIDTTNSEFDYINSSYKISKDYYGNYSTEAQPAESQKNCWLTGGTGLYIGFFGNSGYDEPDFATHLKAVDIACDNWVDSNDDGIKTVNECIDAYYKPYYSSYPDSSSYIKGYAKCPLSSFTGDPNHIKVNECYETIDGKQYNRIRFVFEAKFLYKNRIKSMVRKNEKIKLTILDNYYSDNSGEYNLIFYRGVTTNKVEGILEKIIRAIEEAFSIGAIKDNFKTILHSTNILNINNFSIINEAYAENDDTYSEEEEVYEKKVSIIKRFYLYIVKDSSFMQVIRIFIALYISFLGLRVAMGTSEYSVKELLILLLKLTFILGFTTETGWEFYNKYIVRFFLLGLMSITITIINIVNKLYLFTNANGSLTYLRITDSGTLSQIFGGIDQIIKSLFSKSVTIKIFALFFGHWYGFLVVPIIYALIFYFMYQILNASFPIIIAYVQLIFGLMLGPVFICLYLFKTTEHMFKNWLSFLCARAANIIFVVLMLSTFASIIKEQFNALLNFSVRTTALYPLIFSNDEWFLSLFGIPIDRNVKVYVPDLSGTHVGCFATFFTTIMHLILIFVLIFMFGKLAKMIPSIADSMIKIGDGDGGKMGKIVGNSTFTETMDKSFNSFFDTNEGMLKTAKRIGGNLTAPVVDFLDNRVWTRMKHAVVSNWYYKRNKAWESTTKGMTSEKAIEAITNNYADTLGSKWFRRHGTMNKRMSEFREDVQKHFLAIEANNLRDKLLNNEEIMKRYGDLLNNQAVINRLIQNQIGMKVEKYDVGKYDTYLSKIANIRGTNDITYDETKFQELQKCFEILTNKDTTYLSKLQTKYEELKKVDYKDKIKDTFNILHGADTSVLLNNTSKAESLTKVVEELREAVKTVDELKKYSFLMQGINIDTFGTGASMSNFCMSGIGNDFLGFNGGASAITSGMGVALTNNEESKNIVESIKPFIFYEYRKLREQDYKDSETKLAESDKTLKDKIQKLKELKEQKKEVTYELRITPSEELKQEVSQLSADIKTLKKEEKEATKAFIDQNKENLKNIKEEEEIIKLELTHLKKVKAKEKEKEEREKRLEELKAKKIEMAKRLKESLKESTDITKKELENLNERITESSKKVKTIMGQALISIPKSKKIRDKRMLSRGSAEPLNLYSISDTMTPEKKKELLGKNADKLDNRLNRLDRELKRAAKVALKSSSSFTPEQKKFVQGEINNSYAELEKLRKRLGKSKTAIDKELKRQKDINSILSDIKI